jgi:hypothetical protein
VSQGAAVLAILPKTYCAAKRAAVKIYCHEVLLFGGLRAMLDLLTDWYDIVNSTVAPLWLKGIALFVTCAPLILIAGVMSTLIVLLRYGRRKLAFAHRHGWQWRGANVFSGRIDGDVPWDGGCHESDDAGRYMTWSAGPLRVDNRQRLMLITRPEYERAVASARQAAQRERTIQPRREDVVPSLGLGVAVPGAQFLHTAQLALPDCRRDSWVRDPQMKVWPVGAADFARHFVVIGTSEEFAKRVVSARLQAMLLMLPWTETQRFKGYLRSNRLTVEAAPGYADEDTLAQFIKIGILMAELASHRVVARSLEATPSLLPAKREEPAVAQIAD